jgi:hypothetical protein
MAICLPLLKNAASAVQSALPFLRMGIFRENKAAMTAASKEFPA